MAKVFDGLVEDLAGSELNVIVESVEEGQLDEEISSNPIDYPAYHVVVTNDEGEEVYNETVFYDEENDSILDNRGEEDITSYLSDEFGVTTDQLTGESSDETDADTEIDDELYDASATSSEDDAAGEEDPDAIKEGEDEELDPDTEIDLDGEEDESLEGEEDESLEGEEDESLEGEEDESLEGEDDDDEYDDEAL